MFGGLVVFSGTVACGGGSSGIAYGGVSGMSISSDVINDVSVSQPGSQRILTSMYISSM